MGAGVAKLYKEVMNGARFLVVIATADVIPGEAIQPTFERTGLLRRFAPRNDGGSAAGEQ
jgi:hypothetical protein